MHTPVENFQISVQGFSTSPKQLKWVLSRVVCLCVGYGLNGTILGNGNHFEGYSTSQSVPFVRELLGDLTFARYKPTKNPNFGHYL